MKKEKVILEKKELSSDQDTNWFFFAMSLSHHLFSDYIQLKICYHLEPLTLAPSNFVNMVEVIEKSLKLYLTIKEKREKALSFIADKYGHNLETMRKEATKYNQIFDSQDVQDATSSFNDKPGRLFQKLRYGSQKNIDGFKTRLSTVMPVVEKIFYTCIFDLDENDKAMLHHTSILFSLITGSHFDQTNYKEFIISLIKQRNPYYTELERYYLELKQKNPE